MESVIPTVSDRDTQAKAKRGIEEELEASPFANGIGSLLVHTCQQEYKLQEEEGGMGMTAYRLVGPNTQATAQKHDGHPICLGDYTLRLGMTPRG